jgi:DnaD/phage-associated family protein
MEICFRLTRNVFSEKRKSRIVIDQQTLLCYNYYEIIYAGEKMKYRLTEGHPDSFLILPDAVLEKLTDAGEGEIKVLLFSAQLLKYGAMEEADLISNLKETLPEEEIATALAFWRGCGILKSDSGKKGKGKKVSLPPQEMVVEEKPKKIIDADEAPFYTSKDLAEAAERMPDFKNLVSFAEGRLEKVMNTSELARLYSFLDYLKMPLDVVMLVIEDCVSREKRSLRYITKMLTSFQDDGIDTYEKAEEYFAARQEKTLYEKHVRRLFGLGERKLTSAEDQILDTWRKTYRYGEDMLDAAYEKTVASAKTPSIKYMHKILESWHAAGVNTPDEIGKVKDTATEKTPKSYDLDSFFEKAVSKGRTHL